MTKKSKEELKKEKNMLENNLDYIETVKEIKYITNIHAVILFLPIVVVT